MTATAAPLIEARNVSQRFGAKPDLAAKIALKLKLAKPAPVVHALDNVSLSIRPGEVVGLVGESGCGKSTLGRAIAGITSPSQGQILWKGMDRSAMSKGEQHQFGLASQMIFQNPMAALNPRMTVEELIWEAPRTHGLARSTERDVYVDSYLMLAGFDPAMKSDTRTNFPVASGSASILRARSPCSRNSSSVTKASRHSTFPSRPR